MHMYIYILYLLYIYIYIYPYCPCLGLQNEGGPVTERSVLSESNSMWKDHPQFFTISVYTCTYAYVCLCTYIHISVKTPMYDPRSIFFPQNLCGMKTPAARAFCDADVWEASSCITLDQSRMSRRCKHKASCEGPSNAESHTQDLGTRQTLGSHHTRTHVRLHPQAGVRSATSPQDTPWTQLRATKFLVSLPPLFSPLKPERKAKQY